MFFRVCLGKPPFKPGSRHDRRLQRVIEKERAKEDHDKAAEIEGLMQGYDTIGTSTGDNFGWEMEVEDWEETGG